MNCWYKVRILLLTAILGCGIFTLGKSIVNDDSSDRPSSFFFTTAVVLPGWQFIESNSLEKPTFGNQYISGRHYRYVQKSLPLDIEMRYLVNTDGDVKKLLNSYTPIRFSEQLPLRRAAGVGFYSLFVYQERAYLSACINPSGGSTVTDRQFRHNRNIYDVLSSRFILWLLNQVELRDERCLWANLSVPLKDSNADSFKTLEKAWFSWYQWWKPRFPK